MCDQWSKSEKTKCTLKERLKQVKTELRDTQKLRVDAEKRLHTGRGDRSAATFAGGRVQVESDRADVSHVARAS